MKSHEPFCRWPVDEQKDNFIYFNLMQNETKTKYYGNQLQLTIVGSFDEPGTTGTPVIKSLVSNGRKTIEREHDGIRLTGSRSKWIGINITGICEMFFIQSFVCKIYWNDLENRKKMLLLFWVYNEEVSFQKRKDILRYLLSDQPVATGPTYIGWFLSQWCRLSDIEPDLRKCSKHDWCYVECAELIWLRITDLSNPVLLPLTNRERNCTIDNHLYRKTAKVSTYFVCQPK